MVSTQPLRLGLKEVCFIQRDAESWDPRSGHVAQKAVPASGVMGEKIKVLLNVCLILNGLILNGLI